MKRTRMKAIIIAIIAITISTSLVAQYKYTPDWKSLNKHNAVPEWFADAKLGVYFHWGVYSVPAMVGEWYPRIMYIHDVDSTQKPWWWGHDYHVDTYGKDFHYHDFIPMWEAPEFDAKEWVDMFEGMGARIIGAIAEHHDGFSLWDSKVNEWNSAKMGPKIDVVKAIADETKKRDLKFMATFHHGFHGLFYPKDESSLFLRPNSARNRSYHNCHVPQDEKYRLLYGNYSYQEMQELWIDKLDEVIDAHCPDYIWMDFGQKFIKEDYRQQFLCNYFNRAAELNKEVVVNTKGDFFPTDLAIVNVEQSSMDDIQDEVWVTDFILGAYWCYNKKYRVALDPKFGIRFLADVVSKNGVMLLSAGPMADGTMPPEQVESMAAMGRWTKLYGQAIYDTRPFDVFGEGPSMFKSDKPDGSVSKKQLFKLNPADVRYTRNDNIVYAIQLGWDNENTAKTLSAFALSKGYKVKKVTVLGSKEKVIWKQSSLGLKVLQPKYKPALADSALVYKIELKN
ncbi:alpha-L-fucosidase [Saccharicrinis fermentans]|uniref:alpha-L-fucosidase n=1 Tax=Saccharicrinis fermentans DSM 9555 = JCM 21142 TaxID=869213 RepID=W7YTF3_9BACT|nr:alpha-L-fucosidase [Saccharicrinis fermentans]GAF05719.1 alpha-L-fucosidase [Saccharicrinis fermentans DSM 9555 = JCM 21142]